MGKGKKRFNKKEAEHFYLLHRSQTDSAREKEERPSDFVLVKAEDAPQNKSVTLLSNRYSAPTTLEMKQQQKAQRKGVVDMDSYFSSTAGDIATNEDHIDAMGFKNDGYDYSQHLKVMGGGVFVGSDGKRKQLQSQVEIDLPPDALPSSGKELDRHLEAVTIDHNCMDEDLHAALFDDDVMFGEGNDCAFEEINDDFVSSAMAEPETPDFDYDKHIAELIERSRRGTDKNTQGPRGWEDRFQDGTKNIKHFDEDSDEVESFYGSENDDEINKQRCQNDDARWNSSFQRQVEDQFDKIAGEYEEDENIGDLEEEALEGNGDICGTIELEDEDNVMLNEALNEFLQESKDEILCNGLGESTYKKGSRNIDLIEKWEPSPDSIDKEEVAERLKEMTLDLPEEEEDLPEEEYITQEYLRERREEEQWDCETILSTYSTLDNHPSMISADRSRQKRRVYKGRGRARGLEDDDSAGGSVAASSYQGTQYSNKSQSAIPGGRFYSKGQLRSMDSGGGRAAKKIVLAGKHSLPLGFGLAGKSASSSKTGGSHSSERDSEDEVVDLNSRRKKLEVPFEKIQEEDEDDEEEEEHSGSSSEDEQGGRKAKVKVTKRKETAEEKRQRKARVKEERRSKRAMKKEQKMAFRREETRLGFVSDQRQDTDRISVFKY